MTARSGPPYAFFVAEDADHTIVDSALDSVRYLAYVSERDPNGHLMCRSVDGDPDGLVPYRGRFMDGVGYCADSIFGCQALVRLGRVLDCPELEVAGFSYLDHALSAGFFDDPELPVFLYRDVESGEFLHNLEARSEYLELGHIARVGRQLLLAADLDADQQRAARCRDIAVRVARWAVGAERCANGWYPRRCKPDREVYPWAPDAFGPVDLGTVAADPIHDRSGAGAFVIELAAAVTDAGLADLRKPLGGDVEAFMSAGGHFGSTNTDTEDLAENVSYAVAFQALVQAADVLDSAEVRDFAYEHCLAPLEQFELAEDCRGVQTKGLLYMEDSWNAACTWEIAEAAQAYLIAFGERGWRTDAFKALTMLRAVSRHHHGPNGFLTEAVDWDGHSVPARHFPGETTGDIRTTHPFLNNLHIVNPTATYLEHFALRQETDKGEALFDMEGNHLCSLPVAIPGVLPS
jgi:hypothetical protein